MGLWGVAFLLNKIEIVYEVLGIHAITKQTVAPSSATTHQSFDLSHGAGNRFQAWRMFFPTLLPSSTLPIPPKGSDRGDRRPSENFPARCAVDVNQSTAAWRSFGCERSSIA